MIPTYGETAMQVRFRASLSQRAAMTRVGLIVMIGASLLLLALIYPAIQTGRRHAKRAQCFANVGSIMQAIHRYANDNREWFPHHVQRYQLKPEERERAASNKNWKTGWEEPVDHGIRWIGMMGGTEELPITEHQVAKASPGASHPSRSLFLLVYANHVTTKQYVCPMADDQIEVTMPPIQRQIGGPFYIPHFDFAGYENLSYGYRLPYSGAALRTDLPPDSPVVADKGPYFESAGEVEPGSKRTPDRRSTIVPNEAWRDLTVAQILALRGEKIARYNSRNHAGRGQHIGRADGSVVHLNTPFYGAYPDNIYTVQMRDDPVEALIGYVPDKDETIGPKAYRDAFIVP